MPRRPLAYTFTTRMAFFAREQETWHALTATWADVPDALLLLPGASGAEWSIKDVMNHVAAWQEAARSVITDLIGGRWGHLGLSTERFNAHHYAADRDRPLRDSRQRVVHARGDLLVVLATVADEHLLTEYGRQQIGWWAKWTTYAHYEQHMPALTVFRQQRHQVRTDLPDC